MGRYSIVICTFNNGAALAETLESLARVDTPAGIDVECCLVDNNSTDTTRDVCHAFVAKRAMPARYVFEPQQGLSAARNRGVREATGETILFTDDDVIVDREWLSAYARAFDTHAADAVFGRILPDWRGHKPPWFSDKLNAAYALLDYGDVPFVVSQRRHEFYGANFGVRKSALKESGGFDLRLGRTGRQLFVGEELQLFLSMLRAGRRIVYDPAVVVHHVIAERRKTPAYLEKYYRDVAQSLVVLGDGNPRRQVLGVPFYRARELVTFYLSLPFELVRTMGRQHGAERFALRLATIRTNALTRIYARRALGRSDV